MARILIVDDTPAFAHAAVQALHSPQAKAAGIDPRAAAVSGHAGFLADPARHEGIELALVDAYDDHSQRLDPSLSRFAVLPVADALAAMPTPVPLVVHSLDIGRPEVFVPANQLPGVRACYRADDLLVDLVDIVARRSFARAGPPPRERDAMALGVGPSARILDAVRLLQSRADAWELVWQPEWRTPPKAVRDWIRERVVPLLDLPSPGYRAAVRVTQRVCWLPARRPG